MITHISINEDLNVFATSSLDGSVILYQFPDAKILRTFFHPQNLPLHSVVITSAPLACVLFQSKDDCSLYSYHINGKFLDRVIEESNSMINPLIVKDSYHLDKLVYILILIYRFMEMKEER
jgi:hypothetical protein